MKRSKVIGEKLRAIRTAKGWSRDDLAERASITKTALVNYEDGFRIPRDLAKIKISKAVGVSIEELFFFDKDKPIGDE